MLELRMVKNGPYYSDYEVFSRRVIISPIGTRIYQERETLVKARQVRSRTGKTYWIDLDNRVFSAETLEKFYYNICQSLGVLS